MSIGLLLASCLIVVPSLHAEGQEESRAARNCCQCVVPLLPPQAAADTLRSTKYGPTHELIWQRNSIPREIHEKQLIGVDCSHREAVVGHEAI